MLSNTEENYLKALLKITLLNENEQVGTNELAKHLNVKPATANDMLKKLKEKSFVEYEKYGKINLTDEGKTKAIYIVRKHRLWETFLYEKLDFSWDEVHEVAEQLEHIQSTKLIDKLDKYLNFPLFDPHGDPIPNTKGEFLSIYKKKLSDVEIGQSCKMVAVRDNSSSFLQYVVKLGLGLNNQIKVISKQDFDGTIEIEVEEKKSFVSTKFAENLFVI
ncbi:MAG: metal-dependent transcriptional regulator [Bacteroidetes bacterium]|nr:MAG: metal-dependent transcriptional regulator [Bacteroidota bacterium]